MAMCLTFTVISCRKDDTGGKTDPLPFPMDDNKDLSVSPGDDFFSYCNGTWYKNTPTPASGTVGGVYDAERAMVQRVEEMKKDVPDVRRFFEGMDHMWDTPEASMAYVQKLVDAIPVPQNHEEAFRYAGKLLMEGVPTIVEILHWAEKMRGEHFLNEDGTIMVESNDLRGRLKTGLPSEYGMCSIFDVVD